MHAMSTERRLRPLLLGILLAALVGVSVAYIVSHATSNAGAQSIPKNTPDTVLFAFRYASPTSTVQHFLIPGEHINILAQSVREISLRLRCALTRRRSRMSSCTPRSRPRWCSR